MSANSSQQKQPLIMALLDNQRRHALHMPGNRGGAAFEDSFREILPFLETTELTHTGDINAPAGAVAEALDLAAAAFGAGASFFITTGTSTALKIALATVMQLGDRILLPRGSHLSIVYGIAELGLEPVFIGLNAGPRFCDGQPNEEDVLAALAEQDDLQAVLLTSPGYYGNVLPLARIAAASHAKGIPLIVDEAHGAHFAMCPELLPPAALAQGADIVCQSAHKTLPALTGGSYLHISALALAARRVSRERMQAFLPVFQSSSPSFPIAASLDYARSFVALRGEHFVRRLLARLTVFTENLPEGIKREFESGDDPTRLVLNFAQTGYTHQEVAQQLGKYRVDVEFIDAVRLVAILPFDTPEESLQALLRALQELPARKRAAYMAGRLDTGNCKNPRVKTAAHTLVENRAAALDLKQRELFCRKESFVMNPREAVFGRRTEFVDLARETIACSGGGHKITASVAFTTSEGVSGSGQPSLAQGVGNAGLSRQKMINAGDSRALERPLTAKVGAVAGQRQAVCVYPPGVALFWPGEIISQAEAETLQEMKQHGLALRGWE